MKLIILTLIFISSLYSVEPNWLNNYDKALQQAKKEYKDVYLFIGADNCRFCEIFKKTTLWKKEVITDLEKEYVLLFLNRDQHEIPKHFAIQGVPRHYFLTSDGKIIHEDAGIMEPDGFYLMLDEVDLKKE
ncbi:MAG: thioredoxin family protein [Campylobacterota bacterium]|nr:thioredoxin family protein [Campylobacterota bacterium]